MAASEEFGRFLRGRRARVRPSDVGLPAGLGIRRTPGLRREELAALAGVSIDYYTRLEQGKETNPSSEVLAALAAALRLDADGLTHLYAMANHAARRSPSRSSVPSRTVRPAVRQLLETLRPYPASVLSRISDVLAANPESLALYPGLTNWPVHKRNTIRYVFIHPAARLLFDDWHDAATSGVANLRTVLAHDPDAPDLAALVNELTRDSPDFAQLWGHYDVTLRRSKPKVFHHPVAGDMTLWHEVLRLSDDGQRLGIYQAPPGSPDHDALTLLAMAASESERDTAEQARSRGFSRVRTLLSCRYELPTPAARKGHRNTHVASSTRPTAPLSDPTCGRSARSSVLAAACDGRPGPVEAGDHDSGGDGERVERVGLRGALRLGR